MHTGKGPVPIGTGYVKRTRLKKGEKTLDNVMDVAKGFSLICQKLLRLLKCKSFYCEKYSFVNLFIKSISILSKKKHEMLAYCRHAVFDRGDSSDQDEPASIRVWAV